MATQMQSEFLVLGRITDKLDRPQANLLAQAFDRDMRTEELLGECLTDKNGEYKIAYVHNESQGRGKKTADISLKIYTQGKTLVYKSDIDAVRFNASAREEINVVLTAEVKLEEIEYEYILRAVIFLADTIKVSELQENDQNRDITFLSKETEIDRKSVV